MSNEINVSVPQALVIGMILGTLIVAPLVMYVVKNYEKALTTWKRFRYALAITTLVIFTIYMCGTGTNSPFNETCLIVFSMAIVGAPVALLEVVEETRSRSTTP